MRRQILAMLVLLAVSVALYLLPSSLLGSCRLYLYSQYISLFSSLSIDRSAEQNLTEPACQQRLTELKDLLIQKDAEIASLRAKLAQGEAFRAAYSKFQLSFTPANILAFGGGSFGDAAIIDRGAADGLEIGDLAMQGRAVAGYVAELEQHTARILLLTAPGFILPARTASSRENVSVHGEGRGRAKVIFYSLSAKARKGEAVLGGLKESNWPDLLLGTLDTAPRPGTEAGTFEAMLTMRAELGALESILLIRGKPAPPPVKEAPAAKESGQPGAVPAGPAKPENPEQPKDDGELSKPLG